MDNIQEGMKHQMGGATQAQQGITFAITLIFTFYFLPSEPDLSQNVRTGLKTGAGLQPAGENRPALVFSYIFGQSAEAGNAAKLCTNYRRV